MPQAGHSSTRRVSYTFMQTFLPFKLIRARIISSVVVQAPKDSLLSEWVRNSTHDLSTEIDIDWQICWIRVLVELHLTLLHILLQRFGLLQPHVSHHVLAWSKSFVSYLGALFDESLLVSEINVSLILRFRVEPSVSNRYSLQGETGKVRREKFVGCVTFIRRGPCRERRKGLTEIWDILSRK